VVGVVVLVVLVGPALAHVPGFAGENTSQETAMHLEDGAKSRAIYATLDKQEVRYYEVHLDAGERLQASVFTPTPGTFTPSLAVYGPGVEPAAGASADLPVWVDIPDGMDVRVVPGSRDREAEFEPFTPAAYYQTARVSIPVESAGTYWVAVYEPDGTPGRVGTAIGYVEEFTPVEMLRVPVDLIGVHLWEGDHPVLLVGPYVLGLLGGIAFVFRRVDWPPTGPQATLALSGSLFLGGAVLTAVQLGLALVLAGFQATAVLSLLFVAFPLAIGLWLLVTGRRYNHPPRRIRALIAVAAVFGLVTWGGIIIGPALALVAAAWPSAGQRPRKRGPSAPSN
jgi:hypothetical protein